MVSARKDVWTGCIYIAIGVAALLIARHYPMGSAGRMGPGYFPIVIAGMLALVGAVILLHALLRGGAPVGPLAVKPMLLVLASIVAFGFLLERAGLIAAAVVLVLGCAAASERFRPAPLPLIGMAALIGFCVLVFVIAMGIPMPLIGPWLGGGV